MIQRIIELIKNKKDEFSKKHHLIVEGIEKAKVTPHDYFTLAKNWADDFYVVIEASRNRWKALCLWILTPILILLLILITLLVPIQKITPLVINHYQDGQTIVTPFSKKYAPTDQAQVESDIARYVSFRESYSADTYDYSYRLINLMSALTVANAFNQLQNVQNKNSPINLLGNKGYQSVKIESISFLDNENKNNKMDSHHRNLAQVNFVVTTFDKESAKEVTTPLTALLSWTYAGTPNDPSDRWMDWNGFKVESYVIEERNS